MIKHTQPTFHFLLTSLRRWHTSEDLHAAMKYMDMQKETYWVWYVPGPESARYEINFYQPQVEGSFVLAHVEFDSRGRIFKLKEGETV